MRRESNRFALMEWYSHLVKTQREQVRQSLDPLVPITDLANLFYGVSADIRLQFAQYFEEFDHFPRTKRLEVESDHSIFHSEFNEEEDGASSDLLVYYDRYGNSDKLLLKQSLRQPKEPRGNVPENSDPPVRINAVNPAHLLLPTSR